MTYARFRKLNHSLKLFACIRNPAISFRLSVIYDDDSSSNAMVVPAIVIPSTVYCHWPSVTDERE